MKLSRKRREMEMRRVKRGDRQEEREERGDNDRAPCPPSPPSVTQGKSLTSAPSVIPEGGSDQLSAPGNTFLLHPL